MWDPGSADGRVLELIEQGRRSVGFGRCPACGTDAIGLFAPEGRCQTCADAAANRLICVLIHRDSPARAAAR